MRRRGTMRCSLLAIRIIGEGGEIGRSVDTDQDFFVELEFKARRLDKSLCVGFDLANSDGVTVLRSYQTDSREANWPTVQIGCNRWRCKIPRGLLNGGTYLVNPRISIHNVAWIVHEDAILEFPRQSEARRITALEFDLRRESARFDGPCSRLDSSSH